MLVTLADIVKWLTPVCVDFTTCVESIRVFDVLQIEDILNDVILGVRCNVLVNIEEMLLDSIAIDAVMDE